jgi:hypothetical protein
MLVPDLFMVFIQGLQQAGIPYVVTGSVAVIVYGDPRMTHDIDLVVELHRSQIAALINAFPEEQFYCPPVEVITTESARSARGHFNIIHHETGFKADIYPVGNDALLAWAIKHARTFDLGGLTLQVAPPEYVIVKKLEFYREGKSAKHLSDIAGMLAASADLIDFKLLKEKLEQYGLKREWEQATLGVQPL